MNKTIYIVELENKYPEFNSGFSVAVIAKSKDEAESKVRKKYPNLDIESTIKHTVNNIIK